MMGDVAPHIRGRVFPMSRVERVDEILWGMEVVNYATGEVIITDNATNLPNLMDECYVAVITAKGAWFYELSQNDVTDKPPKRKRK